MREIKFKYFWKGRWYYVDFYKDNVNLKTAEYEDRAKTSIWYQYTGLKDKNGKEIYEGDIVKGDFEGNIGVGWIQYDDKRDVTFYVEMIVNDLREHQPHRLNQECEIIGNKFENPELLT